MKKTSVILFLILIYSAGYSQNNAYAFFEYDIKDGMRGQFVEGYAKDLEWHKSQGDEWSWIGWFILNGDRRGRFVDATPAHNWSDFDNWKISTSENSKNNKIHWTPYVTNASGGYKIIMDSFSRYENDWFKKKYLQTYHIQVKSIKEEDFREFLTAFKRTLQNKLDEIPFVWMKNVSGGDLMHYQLFLGLDQLEDLQLCEDLFYFSSDQKELFNKYNDSTLSNYSELWGLNESLSLIADE